MFNYCKTIGRIQESIETFFSSMSAGAQALYEDRTKTATLIGGLTLLAGGGGLVGGVDPGFGWAGFDNTNTIHQCDGVVSCINFLDPDVDFSETNHPRM